VPIRRISRKSPTVTPLEVRRETGIEPDSSLVDERDSGINISKAELGAWLERMRAFRGTHWIGYAETLQRERDEWDQRH
jgi:bifunctional DNA-binding transcriptional regulator/antitoxin component of YhaV-PrlF toxin-antitoxin module